MYAVRCLMRATGGLVGKRRLLLVVLAVAVVAGLGVPRVQAAASAGAAWAGSVNLPAAVVTHIGKTTCTTSPNGSATCTGTYGGDRAFDPSASAWPPPPPPGTHEFPPSRPPTVTVDQTTNLTNQVVRVSWKNFTPSTDEVSGQPTPNLLSSTLYHAAIYQCRGTNPQSPVGNGLSQQSKDCYDVLNTTGGISATHGPANGVKSFTSANATGAADFYVEAGEVNNFLACGPGHPCSLVIVPNWGGVEPVPGVARNCADHSQDSTFIVPFGADQYIGSPCSWADRIVVPLSFRPSPANCPPSAPGFQSEGSPMLERAMSQWIPGYCHGPNAVLPGYVPINEYIAREQFLSGPGPFSQVDMALVTRPASAQAAPGSSRKFTYAPVANSGVAIAYYIDDPRTGLPITNLVLNARLVAKLLTQSYALSYDCTMNPGPPQNPPPAPSSLCDPAITHVVSGKRVHNPDTIFDDPEFLSLNGGDTTANRGRFPPDTPYSVWGDFLPLVVSGDSDMTYELTRWVTSDPAARAFLQGRPDRWGMVVNRNYRNIGYPAAQFVPLDPGWTGNPANLVANQYLETMQASWNPVGFLGHVGLDLVSNQPTANSPVCYSFDPAVRYCAPGHPYGVRQLPPEVPGFRDLTAVLDLGQGTAYRFPVAKLVNAAGRAVAPTAASLSAALRDMKTNADGITQYANYASTDPNAYPLIMADYAMVPVCGLSHTKASAMSTFVTDVATTGQQPGVRPGRLATGYLPLDPKQRSQALAAARAVRAQNGCGHP